MQNPLSNSNFIESHFISIRHSFPVLAQRVGSPLERKANCTFNLKAFTGSLFLRHFESQTGTEQSSALSTFFC